MSSSLWQLMSSTRSGSEIAPEAVKPKKGVRRRSGEVSWWKKLRHRAKRKD